MRVTQKEVLEHLTLKDAEILARWVHKQVCQCCGGDPIEQFVCGHFRCKLCQDRDHVCIACLVAV